MRCSNPVRLRQQVQFLQRQFLQAGDLPFTDVLSSEMVSQALTTAEVVWKDRIYTPLVSRAGGAASLLLGDRQLRIYPPRILVGLMVISYLGSVFERWSLALMLFISALVTATSSS